MTRFRTGTLSLRVNSWEVCERVERTRGVCCEVYGVYCEGWYCEGFVVRVIEV